MKIKRKVLSALLATMLLITALLSGCVDDGGTSDTTALSGDVTSENTDSIAMALEIITAEGSQYKIIRGAYANSREVDAAKELNVAFRDKFSATWVNGIADDFIKGQTKETVHETDTPEILVGYTNRKESRDVYQTLKNDEYAIKVVRNKLVIVGIDSYATAAAVNDFIENYIKKADGIELKFEANFEIRGETGLRKVAINTEAQYRLMTWNLGCMCGKADECIDVILRYLPDIIGLQECNKEVHDKVLAKLPEYFAFCNKTHNKSSTVNYTPIMYNTNLFTLKESDVVWLRGRYTGTNTKSLSWAVFDDKNGETFAMINYHGAVCSNSYKGFENFTSDQLNAQALEWRLDNVVQVIEVKDSIIAKYGNIPVIVNGDCNFNSASQPYADMMKAGFSDSEFTARVSTTTGYTTSFSYGSSWKSGKSIDHIFGLNGVDFVVHDIVRDDEVIIASDHCPVFVDFNPSKK